MRLAAVALSLLATGCAGACATAPYVVNALPERPAPDMTGVLRLQGRFVGGHACPIAPGLALTAAHVGDLRPFDPLQPMLPFRWSDGDGHSGTVKPKAISREQDLAAYEPEQGTFAHWYGVADGPPAPGTRLWLLGYDWRNSREAFGPRVLEAIVLRVVAGQVVLNRGGWPGASGSCWLNADAAVVAIHSGTAEMESGARVGVAVGVWK